MRTILDPVDKKMYLYYQPNKDWFFCHSGVLANLAYPGSVLLTPFLLSEYILIRKFLETDPSVEVDLFLNQWKQFKENRNKMLHFHAEYAYNDVTYPKVGRFFSAFGTMLLIFILSLGVIEGLKMITTFLLAASSLQIIFTIVVMAALWYGFRDRW